LARKDKEEVKDSEVVSLIGEVLVRVIIVFSDVVDIDADPEGGELSDQQNHSKSYLLVLAHERRVEDVFSLAG